MSPTLWAAVIGAGATIIGTAITAIITSPSSIKNTVTQNQKNNQSTAVNITVADFDTVKPKISDQRQISQQGKNNLYMEGDNKGKLHVGDTYNVPPQRHAEKKDIDQITSQASSKDMKIVINSNDSKEGIAYRSEILKRLADIGYTNLMVGTIGMSGGIWGEGRITIHHREYAGEKYLQVALNPQQ